MSEEYDRVSLNASTTFGRLPSRQGHGNVAPMQDDMTATKMQAQMGKRIRAARKRCGLSQEALGERLGLSQDTISGWERGRTNPGYIDLWRLCNLTGLTADFFISGDTRSLSREVYETFISPPPKRLALPKK